MWTKGKRFFSFILSTHIVHRLLNINIDVIRLFVQRYVYLWTRTLTQYNEVPLSAHHLPIRSYLIHWTVASWYYYLSTPVVVYNRQSNNSPGTDVSEERTYLPIHYVFTRNFVIWLSFLWVFRMFNFGNIIILFLELEKWWYLLVERVILRLQKAYVLCFTYNHVVCTFKIDSLL